MPVPASHAEGSGLPRPGDARFRNERIAATVKTNRFDRQVAVPFICECSEYRCEELIRLTLHQFDAARLEGDYLVAPGHQVDDARIVRVKGGIWLYRGEPA